VNEGPAEALARRLKSYCEERRGQTIKLRDLRRNVAAFKRADERTQQAAFALLEDDGVAQLLKKAGSVGRPSWRLLAL